jgi:hypothetical protein
MRSVVADDAVRGEIDGRKDRFHQWRLVGFARDASSTTLQNARLQGKRRGRVLNKQTSIPKVPVLARAGLPERPAARLACVYSAAAGSARGCRKTCREW